MVVLLHFSTTEYYASLKNEEYATRLKNEFRVLLKIFKRNAKLLRKKCPATAILVTLILTTAIVPIDIFISLFTPSYHNDGETFSHAYPYIASDTLCLFMYSNWISPTNVSTEYQFYRLSQNQYTIYPARLPLSTNVSIQNPTTITSGATGEPSSYSLWQQERSNTNLGSLFVNVSKEIKYSFVPQINNFTRINLHIPKASEPLTVNMTYWKLADANVSVTNNKPIYTDLGNGTYLERHT